MLPWRAMSPYLRPNGIIYLNNRPQFGFLDKVFPTDHALSPSYKIQVLNQEIPALKGEDRNAAVQMRNYLAQRTELEKQGFSRNGADLRVNVFA